MKVYWLGSGVVEGFTGVGRGRGSLGSGMVEGSLGLGVVGGSPGSGVCLVFFFSSLAVVEALV